VSGLKGGKNAAPDVRDFTDLIVLPIPLDGGGERTPQAMHRRALVCRGIYSMPNRMGCTCIGVSATAAISIA